MCIRDRLLRCLGEAAQRGLPGQPSGLGPLRARRGARGAHHQGACPVPNASSPPLFPTPRLAPRVLQGASMEWSHSDGPCPPLPSELLALFG
eukprot:14185995-Alexandrium_andersonii.AAC.1